MKVKLFTLLVLAALATGTGVWAAKESAAQASEPTAAVKTSSCCGFCDPDEPCPFCPR